VKLHFWHAWKYVVVDEKATERFCSICHVKEVYCKLPKNLQHDGITEGWLPVEKKE
jgi:hypothetical protein